MPILDLSNPPEIIAQKDKFYFRLIAFLARFYQFLNNIVQTDNLTFSIQKSDQIIRKLSSKKHWPNYLYLTYNTKNMSTVLIEIKSHVLSVIKHNKKLAYLHLIATLCVLITDSFEHLILYNSNVHMMYQQTRYPSKFI